MRTLHLAPKSPWILVAAVLIFSVGASAAEATGYRRYYSNDEYQLAHSMFHNIQSDLNHASAGSRSDLAQNKLQTLEQNWDRGRFDSQQMDAAIAALRAVAGDNALPPYRQDALARDL